MVDGLLALGRGVLTDWLKQHHADLQKQLAGLTPIANGIAFELVFNDVWHEVLGWTSKALAGQDLYQDPREPGYAFRGFVPLVWANGLTQLPGAP